MADLQGGQTFLNVLPSMTGYFKRVRSDIQANPITQTVDVKLNERRLAKAKSDLESMVKAEEAARKKAADAAGAQTVAEAKLQALREKGITDTGRMAAAEEAVAKAKRNSEAAAKSLQEAESRRKVGERRVQRVEATFDGSQAEGQFGSFLQRLADRADGSGNGIGAKLIGGVGSAMKTGALAVGGVVGGTLATAFTKGFGRLQAIEQAQAKLSGLGHSAAAVEQIMTNATNAVKGTAFGLGDAASVAAGAVAAGVEPGAKLERTLKLVGDAASIAGTDLGTMGSIFNKVAASGKIQGDVIAQLSDAGIPIIQLLGKELGKTAEETLKLASDGQINFETFQTAIEKGMGGAALKAGNTFKGAMDNAGAALGRLGAAILDAPFQAAPGIIGKVTDGIDGLTTKVKGILEVLTTGDFGEAFKKAFPNVEEDSPLVDFLFRVREGAIAARDTIALFFGTMSGQGAAVDLPWMNTVIGVAEQVSSWGDRLGGVFSVLRQGISDLVGPVGSIIGSLSQASAAIGFSAWDLFLTVLEALAPIIVGTLVPAVETLARLMDENQSVVTALVGAYTAYKTATYGAKAALAVKTAALKTWTTATTLGTKAVQLKTTAVKVMTTVVNLSKGAMKGAAGAAKAFGAALKANPIGAIITVITLLVGALVWFFTQTETGKKIWAKVWSGIQTALSAAWDFIRPIFDAIAGAFGTVVSFVRDNWKLILPIVMGPLGLIIVLVTTFWDQIKTIFKVAVAVVLTAAILLWEGVKAVFTLIGNIAVWVWETFLQPGFELIKVGLQALGAFFGWVWNSLIKPAWNGLGAGISWVWQNVIQPVWNALKAALQAVGAFFGWVWNSLVKPAWDGLAAGIKWAWENVIRPAWDGLKTALQALGDFFKWIWENAIKPAWDGLGAGINWVWENVIKKAWDAMTGALGRVRDFFGEVVNGIQDKWNGLKSILAKPINFLINTVWNDGIRKAWNKAADLLGLGQADELKGIPEHATGGAIRGPGTGTSDDVLMWGSNGEHMLTAKEVQRVGGHHTVYALRDMIMRGVPFSWDGGQIIRELGRDNLNAYGAQVAQKGLGNVDPQGMFDRLLPAYKDGGEIRPLWQTQLENGHRAAKMRNGNPYTWGFEDCSGYMSMIADAIINGGDGVRRWATGSFPGGQPWVPGLGEGFSVGVHDNPGGPGGGHTAGTLTGVDGFATVNVESGGAHGYVAYGGPAVGADSPQWNGVSPGRYHLAIGADGAFESAGPGGGPSPQQKQSFLQQKIAGIFDFFLNPVKSGIGAAIGTPPPEWLGIPPRFLDHGRDKASAFLSDAVLGLGDLLGSVWSRAKDGFGLFRDQGGWIPNGHSIVWNETGKPEAVLNWDQVHALKDLLNSRAFEALAHIDTNLAAARDAAGEVDWAGVGSQIGTSLLAEWGNDLLGMVGLSGQFEGVKLVDDRGRRSDSAGERNEATFGDAAPGENPAAVIDEVKDAFSPFDAGGLASGKGFLLKDIIRPERVLSPRQTESFEQLIPMLDRMQHSTTAPPDVMPASALSSLEYAPVGAGGDTFNVYGKADRETMNEVGIWSNQRDRSRRYDRGQR